MGGGFDGAGYRIDGISVQLGRTPIYDWENVDDPYGVWDPRCPYDPYLVCSFTSGLGGAIELPLNQSRPLRGNSARSSAVRPNLAFFSPYWMTVTGQDDAFRCSVYVGFDEDDTLDPFPSCAQQKRPKSSPSRSCSSHLVRNSVMIDPAECRRAGTDCGIVSQICDECRASVNNETLWNKSDGLMSVNVTARWEIQFGDPILRSQC